MVAQTAEWVREQETIAQKRSIADGATMQPAVRPDTGCTKLGPATGIGLGVLMGALCWAVIITALVQLR